MYCSTISTYVNPKHNTVICPVCAQHPFQVCTYKPTESVMENHDSWEMHHTSVKKKTLPYCIITGFSVDFSITNRAGNYRHSYTALGESRACSKEPTHRRNIVQSHNNTCRQVLRRSGKGAHANLDLFQPGSPKTVDPCKPSAAAAAAAHTIRNYEQFRSVYDAYGTLRSTERGLYVIRVLCWIAELDIWVIVMHPRGARWIITYFLRLGAPCCLRLK